MCVKSHRHSCLQTFLILLLVLCFLLFGLIVAYGLTVFLVTDSAKILTREGRHISRLSLYNDDSIRSQQQQNTYGQKFRFRRQETDSESSAPFSDQAAEYLFRRNCSIEQWMVKSAQILNLCYNIAQFSENIDGQDSGIEITNRLTNSQYYQCLRDSHFYFGLASLLPLLLVTLSLIAVCRLWLCPIISLAIIYLGLSIALVLGGILYRDGVILSQAWPLFIVIIVLVSIYTLLSLLHILLFSLVTCERRRTNGDNEKILKNRSVDDDDDIDDPNAPLYKNGFSPQKKTDFEEKIKDLKFIDDDMSYIYRRN